MGIEGVIVDLVQEITEAVSDMIKPTIVEDRGQESVGRRREDANAIEIKARVLAEGAFFSFEVDSRVDTALMMLGYFKEIDSPPLAYTHRASLEWFVSEPSSFEGKGSSPFNDTNLFLKVNKGQRSWSLADGGRPAMGGGGQVAGGGDRNRHRNSDGGDRNQHRDSGGGGQRRDSGYGWLA
ncbi:unnamed protein product [Prunus armeniaca]|uniref:Uncharacterized protein n=1 Tax=Prunus armeniaca TaxID=36596 RepID=A0A6J5VCD6_PRUAR|nr:unnamed protein product [Prunus armeniaca]